MTQERQAETLTNPIAEGASKILDLTTDLVKNKLGGIFPKNEQYRYGDINLVNFELEKFGGNPPRSKQIVLDKNGEFKHGIVEHYIGNDHTYLRFAEATWQPASNLEVVRFGPSLIFKLFGQMFSELHNQEDCEISEWWLIALNKRQEIFNSVIGFSKEALIEMGEKVPYIPIDGYIKENFLDASGNLRVDPDPPSQDLSKYREALILSRHRFSLLNDVEVLCSKMRAPKVEEWFKSFTKPLLDAGIFPQTYKDTDGMAWFLPGKIKSAHSSFNEYWYWAVSEDGLAREFKSLGRNEVIFMTRECPEHLLQQGVQIARALIDEAIKNQFPNLNFQSAIRNLDGL
ncbi:MAG TPA: hypothetical protein VIK81_01750 [Patescibacteria group bacterium]